MYADKSQWLLFILCGIITVVGYNFLLIKRDIKGIQSQTQSDYAKCYKPYRTLHNY